jgi:hypothetical protein
MLRSLMPSSANAGSLARTLVPFTGVKVFSATMFGDRAELGDKVTNWLSNNREVELSDITVTQSSDASFHCVSITVFYRHRN